MDEQTYTKEQTGLPKHTTALLACAPSWLGYEEASFDNHMVAVELSTPMGLPSLLYCPESLVLFQRPCGIGDEGAKEGKGAEWCVVSTAEVRLLIQQNLDKTLRRPRTKKLVEIGYAPCRPSASKQQVTLVPLEDLMDLPGVRAWTWPLPEALPLTCQND